MKSISERPPILTIHEDQGDYILRVGDTSYRHLVVGISKLLPDAKRLIVVTPGDVKFFVMEGGDGVDELPEGATSSSGGTASDSADMEGTEVTSQLPQAEEEIALPEKRTRRRKPLREDVKVGHDTACQRCAGTGVCMTMMPDNSTAESMCPICQGNGMIKRYGFRR